MFPIGRCVTVDQKAAKTVNAKIGEIQYVFTNPGCGDNAETHTVREWLSEFGIPVEDEFFKLWHQKIFQLGSIFRKAEKVCSDHTMNDSFSIGRIHLAFAAYDQSKPAGQRQTNNVHIYIAVDEFLELCRKLDCGELRYMLQSKKKNGDNTPLYQCLGGTSAEKLRAIGRARPDGKSLSRVAQSEMFLITRMHYQCWLTSWYQQNANQPAQKQGQYSENHKEPDSSSVQMF